MANWHLEELRNALERRGWRIVSELPGDGYAISASWEIQRSDKAPSLFIDFNGLADMVTLPIEKSYGCQVRGYESLSLYFRKRGETGSNRKQIWQSDLKQFIESLDTI
ncbi:MAG TPA: hypothetical protein VNO70_25085 [Blastocatellia bacterium]|nr:hypothetical protein [Blastocatellia bacterium]